MTDFRDDDPCRRRAITDDPIIFWEEITSRTTVQETQNCRVGASNSAVVYIFGFSLDVCFHCTRPLVLIRNFRLVDVVTLICRLLCIRPHRAEALSDDFV